MEYNSHAMTETLLSSINQQWQSLYHAIPSLELRHGHSYLLSDSFLSERNPLVESLPNNLVHCVYPLHHLALLFIEGQDAVPFLQGQITVDVEAMNNNESLWAAHCDAKGRMHANFILHRLSDQKFALQMSRSVIDIAQRAFSKYAVFSKVDIIDASNDFAGFGLGDDTPKKVDSAITIRSHTASNTETPFTSTMYWLPMPEAKTFIDETIKNTDYHFAGSASWQMEFTRKGLGFIEAQTSGAFIPQMLNMDAIEGISFTKGCYTGQEIIARMKYRGAIKRRCYCFNAKLNGQEEAESSFHSAKPGEQLFNQDGDAIGEIVSSVCNNDQLFGLAVIKTPALNKSTAFYLSNTLPNLEKSSLTITLEPPPYAINNN